MVRSICLISALMAVSARGASDLFLIAAGQLRAASGRYFRTTVWITNLAPQRASVQATFLERHPLKAPSPSVTIDIGPSETKEISDFPLRFQRPGVVGAIRFQSNQPIAVAAHIFSPDAFGAAVRAVNNDAGLQKGDEGFIPGVIYEAGGDSRQTTYLVETGGRPVGVFLRLRDSSGREITHDSFLLEAYEHRSLPIAEIARGMLVHNGSISVRVTGGSGRVYAAGLQIPWPSGDGYFVDMTVLRSGHRSVLSGAEIVLYSLTALAVIAAVALEFYHRKRRASG